MTRQPARLPLLLVLAACAAPAAAQERPRDAEVFRAYEELLELLEAEGPVPPPETEAPSPARFVLRGARLTGAVEGGLAHLEATLDVEVARSWAVLPLGLDEADLLAVRGEGPGRPAPAPMALLRSGLSPQERERLPATGHGLLLRGPGRTTVRLSLVVPARLRPGAGELVLTLPGAALSQLELSLPEDALRPSAVGALSTRAGDGRVEAAYGPRARAVVRWQRRRRLESAPAAASARDPLLLAEIKTSLRIDEGASVAVSRVHYSIHQAPCDRFVLRYPKGYTLLGVEAQGLAAYPTPRAVDGEQELVVRLRRPVAGEYDLVLRLERVFAADERQVAFPTVRAPGSERESSFLAVRAGADLEIEPADASGLTQVDPRALDRAQAADLGWAGRGRPPLVFRSVRGAYGLILRVRPIEAEVEGRVHSLALVREDELAVAAAVRYTIRKRGIFGVRLRLPAGFQLLECGDERLVKDFRTEPPSPEEARRGLGERLVVDFAREQGPGEVDLLLLGLVRRASAAEDERVALPRFRLEGVAKEAGVLAIGAQHQLKLTLEEKRGLLPLGVDALPGLGFPFGAGRGEELVFAFRYPRPEGVSARFSVRRRQPKVGVRVEALVDAQADRVSVRGVLRFTARYAGIDRFRLRVPADLAVPGALKFESTQVKDARPQVVDGRGVWTVSLQGKRIGEFPVSFSYDLEHTALRAGEQREVLLRELEVLDCFSETGVFALKKREEIVVDAIDREGLTTLEARDLPDTLDAAEVVRAYHYVGHPYRLVLRLTKYDFKAPRGIQIRHLHLDEVVRADGVVGVEATLSVQNRSEQALRVALPAGVRPHIKVDGARVTPTVAQGRDGSELQIHLGTVGQRHGEAPFQVRIRYDLPRRGALGAGASLDLPAPRFPLGEDGEVPVLRCTRAVYLPSGYRPLAFDTPLQRLWRADGFWDRLARAAGIPGPTEAPRWRAGALAARAAIAELKGLAPDAQDVFTPRLALPSRAPYLLESLEGERSLRLVVVRSWLLNLLLLALLAAVLAAGALLERRVGLSLGRAGLGAVALSVLGVASLGEASHAPLAAVCGGGLGLAALATGRAVFAELTRIRAERLRERAEVAARVAQERARAAAAEAAALEATAEAETRGGRS
ncbi:MAG: hypothetical protein D6731_21960 [Planctomycetota bacterium]|nr:MAG: hypothetical protein D6731_21960 [Planctomycetota bacterium]